MDVKKPQQEKPDGAMEGGKALEGFGCTIGSGSPQFNFSVSPSVDISAIKVGIYSIKKAASLTATCARRYQI